ncbi:hypothetical protein RhiirA4_476806 [Rhizophagus irregularis]|uniref:Uncharacterized protein n=1 Tax=Rhizophagus irregularis TaxID=588596 RepID=A0A2I1HCD2_9GLOM|nr:hypothetical protein RhiirA4_476806 [Rhizophagus irregularis]
MLNDSEWELLDELCNILALFEKATQDFSGNTYVTLSQIVSIITSLINSLDIFSNLDEKEINDEIIINSDNLEENLTEQQINYNNIREVLENVKKNIYRSLKHYWAIPHSEAG